MNKFDVQRQRSECCYYVTVRASTEMRNEVSSTVGRDRLPRAYGERGLLATPLMSWPFLTTDHWGVGPSEQEEPSETRGACRASEWLSDWVSEAVAMASFSNGVSEAVAVDHSSVHGLGVKATATIPSGQLLFHEAPLLRLQSLSNRNDALVCACCFRFVGSLSNQVDILRRRLNRLSEFDVRPKFVGDRQLSGVVKCGFMCGEIYCSELCRSTHWSRSHSILCTGCVSEVYSS
jgi:hypothetical protein